VYGEHRALVRVLDGGGGGGARGGVKSRWVWIEYLAERATRALMFYKC